MVNDIADPIEYRRLDGQGRHDHNDIAQRAQQNPALACQLTNPGAGSTGCRKGTFLSSVLDQLDAGHESLLPDFADTGQLGYPSQMTGQSHRFFRDGSQYAT